MMQDIEEKILPHVKNIQYLNKLKILSRQLGQEDEHGIIDTFMTSEKEFISFHIEHIYQDYQIIYGTNMFPHGGMNGFSLGNQTIQDR